MTEFRTVSVKPLIKIPRRLRFKAWLRDRRLRRKLGPDGYRRVKEAEFRHRVEVEREFLFGKGGPKA